MLNARGIGFEQCLDALNLSNPDIVIEIHQAYVEAGAEIIQTNTFGANRYKLSEHDLGDQVAEINKVWSGNCAPRSVCIREKYTNSWRCRSIGRSPGTLWASSEK